METQTAGKTMLYCPKCRRKYENGSQRFCNNDGGRLLPAVNEGIKRQTQSNGVFTNLLTRSSSPFEKDEQIASEPRFERKQNIEPEFKPQVNSKVFKPENEALQVKNPTVSENNHPADKKLGQPHILETKSFSKPENSKPARPISRRIKPSEIEKINRAGLGERKMESPEEPVLTLQNPQILIGQIVKGRYKIIDITDQDEISIGYSAADRIENKNVIVRVLMQTGSGNDFQNKLLAEERVSLSHINHPNIAGVFDSGELAGNKQFIVTAKFENETVKEFQQKSGIFNPLRTARIILQASMALSETHQNGILHRNLQPQHFLLTIAETGNEIVRLTNFSISDGRITPDNFAYKSPEQINGQLPTYASDGYSLAVIAYRMLTNRLPFSGETAEELYKSQKAGLKVEPSEINPDLNPLVDKILAKALSYNPSDRYPKARDFGEAFFNAITTSAHGEDDSKAVEENEEIILDVKPTETDSSLLSFPVFAPNVENEIVETDYDSANLEQKAFDSDIHIDPNEDEYEEVIELSNADFGEESVVESSSEKNETLWGKRSPEPTREGGNLLTLLSILGILVLIAGGFWTWRYFNNLEEPLTASVENQVVTAKEPTIQNAKSVKKPADDIDVPPPAREIIAPKDFKFFENSKENLSEQLAKNYRGFSLYYPKTWSKFETESNYLDVKLKDDDGFPKQQFIVTRYESKGDYKQDEKLFPKLVEKSDNDLTKFLLNYEVVSQGKINVNNGWKAYEVKFKGKTEFNNGSKNFEIWGRRIWMPAARPGVNNGFVITMLATSLSDKIEGLDDVGLKGELGDILYTFEPDSSY